MHRWPFARTIIGEAHPSEGGLPGGLASLWGAPGAPSSTWKDHPMQDEPSVDLRNVLSHYDLGVLESQCRDLRERSTLPSR